MRYWKGNCTTCKPLPFSQLFFVRKVTYTIYHFSCPFLYPFCLVANPGALLADVAQAAISTSHMRLNCLFTAKYITKPNLTWPNPTYYLPTYNLPTYNLPTYIQPTNLQPNLPTYIQPNYMAARATSAKRIPLDLGIWSLSWWPLVVLLWWLVKNLPGHIIDWLPIYRPWALSP